MSNLADYFNQDSYELRSTAADDVPVLVSIINEACSYQDEAKGRQRTDPEHLKKRIDETDFYVLSHVNGVMGCFYLEPAGDSLHFGLLTLVPELRKTGLGRVIIEVIIAYASDNSYKYLELDYMSLAPWLKNYYEKFGFLATGEVTKWGSIDLIRMRKSLEKIHRPKNQ